MKKEYTFTTTPDKRIFVERDDALQSAIKLGATTIERTHPDYLKLRVLMTLFGGYFGSRLMSNIRENKGYTYGISAGTLFYPGSGMILISTEADNEYVELLIREVYHEIDKLQVEPVPVSELTMVRNYMLGEMCRNYESPFSLADAWMFIYTSKLDDTYFARSLQAVKEVTPEEMKELAARVNQEEFNLRKVYAKKLVIPDHPVLKERTPLLVNVYENLDAFTLRDLFDEEKKTPLMFDNSATRKPSGDCGVCSRSTFERNWSIFSEHILQSITWDHVFAAGGSVLACLLPLPPKAQKNIRCLRRYFHEEAYPGSDIDLYLYGLNEEEGK